MYFQAKRRRLLSFVLWLLSGVLHGIHIPDEQQEANRIFFQSLIANLLLMLCSVSSAYILLLAVVFISNVVKPN
jgi:hypothetical protein